ncbi:MAG: glutamate-1-semialdehyde 2,1-aminomutase [Cenarchaeum sp. SB0661_bin_35]|nr:glutamate-1-semialdehyde 2,1-aminomutase [Cenarchaeum sp. SB0667_bin_13]MXZ93616.1 glutamate-1-semialdehyde 2,1-aminomutase [Cenarchaeum sp. SB0666_bin_15]MYB46540.1 glutamate-1-semialdehyde 2,1-aminomutase [Cenarchaeum sp. SB0662_bin_33]MYC79729.1 glutamate-1-semialdehyde 2,1-aminomutase [Cenarchaeum sp. SB0661_bin_35]MYD58986.1 glutamate-1-semialdehyde 2,1-aminomutase [Cenarchaeum sp. SB0678_bin_8]MYI51200.1 glutamate-1-semialdehyde 2,1-aminomutase [Cenarchaeum sp. SB0673_bin_9]MYJ27493.
MAIQTEKSAQLSSEAAGMIPGGVNSPVRHYDPYPFFASKSDGSHIWDVDGNQFIDLCNGYGSMLLGHRHNDIIQAVAAQMQKGTLYCVPTQLETTLSNLIADNYDSIEMVRMVNTGGEATMTAVRLARGHTEKNKILSFEGGYHGAHDSVLVKAGSGSATLPASGGVLLQTTKQTLVAKYNDVEGFAEAAESSDDIAAVIMEPVMANMGLILPDRKFLDAVRHITRQRGMVLIFDEVVTGFRVSDGGAQKYFGVTPDITTLAKALGNGFGVAAVGGNKKIMEMLAPLGDVYQASTFAGNPIAATAAISSIRAMRRMGRTIYDTLGKYCARVSSAIDDAATDHKIPHRVHHISSMFQVFFTEHDVYDYATAKRSDTARFQRLFKLLLERGIFVPPSQFETAFLSGAMTDDDINDIISAYAESVAVLAK